ncbi:uncharacterized protein RJT20DRAFT_127335 [Scheffersomyces xylosifermentans]|uniref:uncharacterized protein n=1 Tax=Scheffersomyces xylosifermentans TaxID=1304137 RepID=UPI00315DA110
MTYTPMTPVCNDPTKVIPFNLHSQKQYCYTTNIASLALTSTMVPADINRSTSIYFPMFVLFASFAITYFQPKMKCIHTSTVNRTILIVCFLLSFSSLHPGPDYMHAIKSVIAAIIAAMLSRWSH